MTKRIDYNIQTMDFWTNLSKISSTTLFYDIETFTFNKEKGKQRPSDYKSFMYSFCVGYFYENVLYIYTTPTFKHFLEELQNHKIKNKRFILNAHNGNKFDNHFILKELKLLNFSEFNQKINKTNLNIDNYDYVQNPKNNEVLTKRVKSKTNLELKFKYKSNLFTTEDNFLKTHTSIKVISEKLLQKNYISADDIKTTLDYSKYDKDNDIETVDELYTYSESCYNQITKEDYIYIFNDVKILALCVYYYDKIFYNFNYKSKTFTVNIKNQYTNNKPNTQYQLLKKDGRKTINYDDYCINGLSLYNIYSRFYRGGLNFYNDKYLDTIINEPCFSIDLNSSYPYSMYAFKIPTFLEKISTDKHNYKHFISNTDKYFYFIEISKNDFFNIIKTIKSKVIKQMLIKYYNSAYEIAYINSNTIKILELFKADLLNFSYNCYHKFSCYDFDAKDIIAQNYFIKTQGKSKYLIEDYNPTNIIFSKNINHNQYSKDEIALSKVLLNGIYGIPALRRYFPLAYLDNHNQIQLDNKGYINNERNVIFSSFVTSQSLYNLLEPLQYIDIDNEFLYCDTDSLYLKKTAFNKIPKSIYNSWNLGAWDIEHDNIKSFYILNHKKYSYQLDNNKIISMCAGIPKDTIKRNIADSEEDFNYYITNYFSNGMVVNTTNSILTSFNTITIYNSQTIQEKGHNYHNSFKTEELQAIMQSIKEELFESDNINDINNLLYVESVFGSIGINDYLEYYSTKDNKQRQYYTEFLDIQKDLKIQYNKRMW